MFLHFLKQDSCFVFGLFWDVKPGPDFCFLFFRPNKLERTGLNAVVGTFIFCCADPDSPASVHFKEPKDQV